MGEHYERRRLLGRLANCPEEAVTPVAQLLAADDLNMDVEATGVGVSGCEWMRVGVGDSDASGGV